MVLIKAHLPLTHALNTTHWNLKSSVNLWKQSLHPLSVRQAQAPLEERHSDHSLSAVPINIRKSVPITAVVFFIAMVLNRDAMITF